MTSKRQRIEKGRNPWLPFLVQSIKGFVQQAEVKQLRSMCRRFHKAFDLKWTESWDCPELFGLGRNQVHVVAFHSDSNRWDSHRKIKQIPEDPEESNFLLNAARELHLDMHHRANWAVEDLPAFCQLSKVAFHGQHPSMFLPYGSTLPRLTELTCRIGSESYGDPIDFTSLTKLRSLWLWNRDRVAKSMMVILPLSLTALNVETTCQIASGQQNVRFLKLKRTHYFEDAKFTLEATKWPALHAIEAHGLVSSQLVLPDGPLGNIETFKYWGKRDNTFCVVKQLCHVPELQTLRLSTHKLALNLLTDHETLLAMTRLARLELSMESSADLRPLLYIGNTLRQLCVLVNKYSCVDTETIGQLALLERLELETESCFSDLALDTSKLVGCTNLRHLKLKNFRVEGWPLLPTLDSFEMACWQDPTKALALLPKSLRRLTFGCSLNSLEHLAACSENLKHFAGLEWLDLTRLREMFQAKTGITHEAISCCLTEIQQALPLCVVKGV